MSTLVLTLNSVAAELLGANTRLRVKPMKRGGVEYLALRPSYRVSGKNAMIRVNKAEDGTVTAELPDTLVTELTLPEVKTGAYLFQDVGYGWFLLKDGAEANDAKDPLITVTKSRKRAKKAEDTAADETQDAGETTETQSTDSTPAETPAE